MINLRSKNSGQVMLFTILILSAVFLISTVIAGLLMFYQLSQVTKIVDSAKAIFAADTAIERSLFRIFRCNTNSFPSPSPSGATAICAYSALPEFNPAACGGMPCPSFTNGASYRMTILTNPSCVGAHNPAATPIDVDCIRTTGQASKSTRSFEIIFD